MREGVERRNILLCILVVIDEMCFEVGGNFKI
jgi:hypothetical protein